ncbi:hypothetical protein HYW44_05430 [Candidatus Daviesbacteria bacterium]|nr:hypothetical protein [Candidatus Daviesbacteria bacterium]
MQSAERILTRKTFLKLLATTAAGLFVNATELALAAPTLSRHVAPPLLLQTKVPELPQIAGIYWAGWFDKSEYAHFLKDPRWHDRLPYFATEDPNTHTITIPGDKPEVFDQDLRFIKQSGINILSFVYYKRFSDHEVYNNGLNNYLNNTQTDKPDFSLIIQGSHIGQKQEWPEFCDELIKLFHHNNYKRLETSRPLLFIYDIYNFNKTHGGYGESTRAILELRKKTMVTGLNNPYIVGQNVSGPPVHFGFDAFGAYTLNGEGEHAERPYAELEQTNFNHWEQTKNEGKIVVPLLNIGWDPRPRISHPLWGSDYLMGPWYAQPTPEEIIFQMLRAINWIKQNPEVTPWFLQVYAVNEFDEGGFFLPTKGTGDSRILAFRHGLDLARQQFG